MVTVYRDSVPVYSGVVQAGENAVTLYGQKGNGSVKYVVSVEGADPWEEWVDFV